MTGRGDVSVGTFRIVADYRDVIAMHRANAQFDSFKRKGYSEI